MSGVDAHILFLESKRKVVSNYKIIEKFGTKDNISLGLLEIEPLLIKLARKNEPMKITPDVEERLRNQTNCKINLISFFFLDIG